MAVVKTFRAKRAARISGKDAVVIGTHLESKYGSLGVSAEEFVADARRQRSPLHRYLVWDDAAAAHEHRLESARDIMRSILVVKEIDDEEAVTRAFHNVVEDRGAVYVPAEVVWQTPDFARQVRDAALRELISAQTRLKQYKAFASALALVDQAVEELKAA